MAMTYRSPGIKIFTTGVSKWAIYELMAKKGESLIFDIDAPHDNDYHATLSFMLAGSISRHNKVDPTDEFIYVVGNSSRDIGYRRVGEWVHEWLEDWSRFLQVKLVTPRKLGDGWTTHPVVQRVNVVGQYLLPRGDMAISATPGLMINGRSTDAGEIVLASTTDVLLEGNVVVEHFQR